MMKRNHRLWNELIDVEELLRKNEEIGWNRSMRRRMKLNLMNLNNLEPFGIEDDQVRRHAYR
jgi:hypothetical protein